MKLGIFWLEQIRSVVVVFVKSKLDNGRLHRKGFFNLK